MSYSLSVITLSNGKRRATLYSVRRDINNKVYFHPEKVVTDSRRMHKEFMALLEEYAKA